MPESYLSNPIHRDFPQLEVDGINDGLLKALSVLECQDVIPSRYGETQELVNLRMIIRNPKDRVIRVKDRGENIFAQIGETLWVLSGSDQLTYLSPFLPRAKEFSDDGGKTWRSAYGARLRRYPTGEKNADPRIIPSGFDQLQALVELFSKSRDTRRGHLVLTYPPVDHAPGIDVVCNVALQFIVREGQLHMTIHNRSNDCLWGWSGINYMEFTVLQELLVSLINANIEDDEDLLEVGSYVHNSVSFHVYEHHFDRAKKVLKNNSESHYSFDEAKHYPIVAPSLKVMDDTLSYYKYTVEAIMNGEIVRFPQLRSFVNTLYEGSEGTTLGTLCVACLCYLGVKNFTDMKDPSRVDDFFEEFVMNSTPYVESYMIQSMSKRFQKELDKKFPRS